MTRTRSLLLALSLALAVPGCAAVMSILPKVVSIVTDAMMILDQIDQHTELFFKNVPNPELQAKVATALGKARAALNALNRTAQGIEDADDQRLAEAFRAFQEAYAELLVVVAPFGVQTASAGGTFQVASAGVLYVPAPLALRPSLR